MSSDLIATKVYNVLRRAKDGEIPSIPPDYPLPAAVKLTPDKAAKALDTIHKLAKTGTPPEGETPQPVLNVIKQLSGDLPNTPPNYPLQSVVAAAELNHARKVVRQISDHVKGTAKPKKAKPKKV